jgi:hypothetical protein
MCSTNENHRTCARIHLKLFVEMHLLQAWILASAPVHPPPENGTSLFPPADDLADSIHRYPYSIPAPLMLGEGD